MSPRSPIFRFFIALILMLTLFGSSLRPVLSGPVAVWIITVDSFEDVDDYVANSVCSAGQPTDGPCTLRAAISEANQNIPYEHIIIRLPAGEYDLTIPPDYLDTIPNDNHSGDLNIDETGVANTNTFTIEPVNNGPVVIRSLINDRIFDIDQNARVYITNLSMRDGHAVIDSTNNVNGGGAIKNRGILSLTGVALLENTVSCSSGSECAGDGGAIENWSNLTIEDSTLDGNTALQGGAIWNYGDLTIAFSTLSNNLTSNSGNITNYGSLTIYNSTFSGNSSLSTLSGIYNFGSLNIQSTTMANHGAINAIYNFKGDGKSTSLRDNIFKAEPGGTNCYIQAESTWTSGGYNIVNDGSCQLNTTLGDLPSVDPQLGHFGNWGGSTKTFMLNPGSPAINHRPGSCETVLFQILDDQRHWPRSDGQCDTGAYEFSPFFLHLPFITK